MKPLETLRAEIGALQLKKDRHTEAIRQLDYEQTQLLAEIYYQEHGLKIGTQINFLNTKAEVVRFIPYPAGAVTPEIRFTGKHGTTRMLHLKDLEGVEIIKQVKEQAQ